MQISKLVAVGAVLLNAAVALAGSDTRDCETADKSVVMSAGNGTNTVQIKVVDAKKQAAVHESPVMIMPRYDYNTDPDAADLIIAVPISNEKVISKNHKQLHVTRPDGTECDGRESWDDRSVQRYVLMGKEGASLQFLLKGTPARKLTSDGYLVTEFQCHTHGISSPGGCHVGPNDTTEWK
jgi:hypothetical protein